MIKTPRSWAHFSIFAPSYCSCTRVHVGAEVFSLLLRILCRCSTSQFGSCPFVPEWKGKKVIITLKQLYLLGINISGSVISSKCFLKAFMWDLIFKDIKQQPSPRHFYQLNFHNIAHHSQKMWPWCVISLLFMLR